MSLADIHIIFGRIVSISISICVRFVFAHLQVIGPKTVVLFRNSQYGFGFTLRHFIVFPPESPAVSDVSANARLCRLLIFSLLAINLMLLSFANRWAHTGTEHCRHTQPHAAHGHGFRERRPHQWAGIYERPEAGRSPAQCQRDGGGGRSVRHGRAGHPTNADHTAHGRGAERL